jgi:predicted RNA-binding protein Jag
LSTEAAAPVPAPLPPPAEKRSQVEQLLGDILRLAEWPAKLELKDAADGGIAVAVHFDAEVPGVVAGKKSYLIDSLQFLVNKVVNRPNAEKRWVTLGVGAFPEPRPAGAPAPPPPQAPASVPAAATGGAAVPSQQPQRGKPARGGASEAAPGARPAPRAAPVAAEPEEPATVEVAPEWKALGKLLAGKAAKHGRVYAVMSLPPSERAQLFKAASGEAGVKVKLEGDGHFRRLTLTPDKPTPMPRKMQFPDYEDDEDGED